MEPYIPANAFQVELVYLWDGQRCQNVLHYKAVPDFGLEDMQEAATDLIALWNTHFKPLMPSTLSLIEVKVTDMRSQSAPSIIVGSGLPIVGTSAGTSMPNSVALVITKRTGLRGKSYRGRIYQPGLTEQNVTANAMVAGFTNSFLTAWGNMRVLTLGANVATMAVVSKYQVGIPLVNAIVTPVTGFTSDGQVDSQRRRLPGRGA